MKELRLSTGLSRKNFSEYFDIPYRTLQDWELGSRTPPDYVVELIRYKIEKERVGVMKTNKNGKYDVFNLSTCEYFEVSEEWLENVDLRRATELVFTSGVKQELEVCSDKRTLAVYENIHGSWSRCR